jgi:hypothetical protein
VPRRVLAVLAPEDVEAVKRWLFALGFEVDELDACRPLRQVVDAVAQATLARQMSPPATREEAWKEAAAMTGTRCRLRSWYRWQAAALAPDDKVSGADGPGCSLSE